MTLLERVNQFPPILCRLSARDGLGLASTREIARRSGLAKSTVHEISMLTSWETVPLGVAQKFAMACGVNLMRQKRRRYLLRVRSWSTLARNITPRQRIMLDRLLTEIQQSRQRPSA